MDNKKIQKDFNNLVKFRLSVFIIVIILMTIVAPLYWYFILKQKRKARPIINNNTVTGNDANNNGLLMTIGDVDDSQASNGYALSNLNQPCSNSVENGGLPNLPGAYTPQPCDTGAGLKCVAGVFEGSVCLSELGFFCDSVNDCVPEADSCINNICTKEGDTLNQKCLTNDDCQVLINTNLVNIKPQLYNHVCQKSANQKYGYCKVDLYPYDAGCNSNSDCLNNTECVKQSGNFAITIDSGLSFTFNEQLNWADLNNLIANVVNKGNYQITNWDTTNNKGNLTPTGTNNTNLVAGNYNLSLGLATTGICLEKIPAGGPADLTIGGVNIPCQDGITNIKNFCLPSENPILGQICVNGVVACRSDNISNKQGNIPYTPDCLYNDATEQTILNDYYFGLSSGAFAEYKIGNCTLATRDREQTCDNEFNGCIPPFICIQELDQNNESVNICNTPFKAQICLGNQCPDNYECGNPDGSPPLCKGKSGAFCIENSDCVDDQCNKYRLQVFDPATSKIIKRTNVDILPSIGDNNLNLKLNDPGKNSAIFPNSDTLVVPQKIMYWYRTTDSALEKNYVVTINENNTVKNIYINFLKSTNIDIKDIIMDEDGACLVLYKKAITDTMRERMFNITASTSSTLNLTFYNGFVDEAKVYYINNGSGANLVNPNQLYILNKIGTAFDSNFNLLDSSGNIVTLNNITDYSNHFIASYDNKYATQSAINEGNSFRPYPLLPSETFEGVTDFEQLKTGDEIYYTNVSGTDTILRGTSIFQSGDTPGTSISTTLEENKPYYITSLGTGVGGNTGTLNNDLLYTDGITPENYINYAISDDYYHSVGGYPILNNSKVINQTIDNADNGNYFSLNSQGYYTYGITFFDPDTIANNSNLQLFISEGTYIFNNDTNRFQINGLHRGITYLYNNSDDDIKITSKKINNDNYLIINKGLCYAPELNQSRYINQILQIKYEAAPIGTTETSDYTFDPISGFNNTLITIFGNDTASDNTKNLFFFNVEKTIAQNQSKGFYYRNVSNGENNIDFVNLNQNDSLFYTLVNSNALNNKNENTIAINSRYDQFSYTPNTSNEPEIEYNEYSDFPNLQPLPFSNLVNITNKKAGDNYFIEEQNYIYIYNEDDINNILNFSSSELVLTKDGDQQIANVVTNTDGTTNTYNLNKPQLTWCLVNIVEYDVDMTSEYLKIKIQVPIKYDNITFILNANTNWQLHVYNFVPLNYFNINFTPYNTTSYTYQINDISLLFTGSKGNIFYNDSNTLYSRTGYNNIMIKTCGKNDNTGNNTFPIAGNIFSIYNITDGAGVLLQPEDTNDSKGDYYAVANTYEYSNGKGQAFYNSNSVVSSITIDYPSTSSPDDALVDPDKTTDIRPDFMPFQYISGRPIVRAAYDFTLPVAYVYYSQVGSNQPLTQFNSSSNGRFFHSLLPLTNNQFMSLSGLGSSFAADIFDRWKNKTPGFNTIPPTDGQTIFPPVDDIGFRNTDSGTDEFSQIAQGPDNVIYADGNNGGKVVARQIFSGAIGLPYTGYNDSLYAVNHLFASSLPLGDTFFINSTQIKKDYIVSSLAYDKDGNIIIKNLGNINLNQDHMAHYQTGTSKKASYFNQSNQVAISWPDWLKSRYTNRNNEIPKIRKVIISNNDGNNYADATYYALVDFGGDTNLVYLNNENINFNLAENQGVPTSISIFNNQFDIKDIENSFVMSPTDRLLYILSKTCI